MMCITPLVVGRIALILGVDLGISFFAFAGSILAANGLLNSILWTTTIFFSAPEDMRATGLDQFSFLRTPARDYGHTVIISGPVSRGYAGTYEKGKGKEWWWWKSGGLRPWGSSYVSAHERLNPDLVEISTSPPIEAAGIHSKLHHFEKFTLSTAIDNFDKWTSSHALLSRMPIGGRYIEGEALHLEAMPRLGALLRNGNW